MHRQWSTYFAIVLWALVAFGIQPTMASFLIHFAFTPVMIWLLIVIARWEGRKTLLEEEAHAQGSPTV